MEGRKERISTWERVRENRRGQMEEGKMRKKKTKRLINRYTDKDRKAETGSEADRQTPLLPSLFISFFSNYPTTCIIYFLPLYFPHFLFLFSLPSPPLLFLLYFSYFLFYLPLYPPLSPCFHNFPTCFSLPITCCCLSLSPRLLPSFPLPAHLGPFSVPSPAYS